LTPHELGGSYFRLQPIFPYFLRSRLQGPDLRASRSAVETAFHQHYNEIGEALSDLIQSKDPQERQLGQALINLEYDNLLNGLKLALDVQAEFYNAYEALFRLLYDRQVHRQIIEMNEWVLAHRENYSVDQLASNYGVYFHLVNEHLGTIYFSIKQYEKAEKTYKYGLAVIDGLKSIQEKTKANYRAILYHQLGYVAQKKRQWQAAESYYQRALALQIEFNDRYSQASTYGQLGLMASEQQNWESAGNYYQKALAIFIEYQDLSNQANTYHNLGIVAQEQRQWQTAESYYQQALALKIEFNDRYSQAATYHQLGRVAEAQRQWLAAESYYQQALTIYIEFNDRYEQAGTYHQLGYVAQEQRQWQTAKNYYQQALAIYIEFQDHFWEAGAYHQLGMVAEEQEKWEHAVDYFLQALETYVSFQDEHYQRIVFGSLRRIWQAGQEGRVPGDVVGRMVAETARILGLPEAELIEQFKTP
jgi:tetratricopeptide (TPR) repeat protein